LRFYKVATTDSNKFKSLPKEAQTAFASVYFQYGVAKTLRGNLIANDYKTAINTLLNFTTKTEEITNRRTGQKSNVMQYLSRRCKEARYLLGAIIDQVTMAEAEKLIVAKEKELKDAKG
jgi:ribosomal protein S18